MWIAIVRTILLVSAALALAGSWCHVLEMPAKLGYEPRFYAAVNSSMYGAFAPAGAVTMLGSILLAGVLAFLVRSRRRPLAWAVMAGVAFAAALVAWWSIVRPVNQEAVRAWESVHPEGVAVLPYEAFQDPPQPVVEMWRRRHRRWEYGHATVFAIQLIAFVALAIGVQADSADSPPSQAA